MRLPLLTGEQLQEPKGKQRAALVWAAPAGQLPNTKEHLAWALMVVITAKETGADLNKWVADVRRQAPVFQSQGEAGLPKAWVASRANQKPEIFALLAAAANRQWGKATELEQIAKVMALWSGPERQVRQIFELACSASAQPFHETGASPACGSPAPLSSD